jgi:predicted XRE-type DNA-binding protein
MKRRRTSRSYGPSANTHWHGQFSSALRSQAEVAKLLGISQNRVSQLERQAIAKIQAVLTKGE